MPHSGSTFNTSSNVRCDARYQNECWYSMAWLNSFCASGLQEVSKLTLPSLSSPACASERPVDNAIATARVVLIALLHFFGCFDCEASDRGHRSHKRDTGFL